MAARMVVWQAVVVLVAAALFLIQGPGATLAALLGGCLVMLGTVLMALRVFTGGVRVGAGMALADMIVGMGLKWVVIIGGLYVLLAQWHQAPLPVLAGMGAAMAVNVAALRFKDQA
jgi:ATP synthase protein I